MARRRRPKDYPTISQGGDGRWHAWVSVPRPDGTTRQRHINRATEDEAEEAVDELLEQVDASIPVAPGRKPTFKGWMDHYLEKVAPRRCDPGTVNDYRSLLRHWAYPVAGQTRVDRFSTTHMDEIFDRMEDAGRPVSTQIKMRSVISRGLRVAQVRGLVSFNAAALVDPPAAKKKEMDSLTLDEALAVIGAAKDRRNGVRWELSLATGERQGEALGLRWQYLDLDEAEMKIWWQLRRRAFVHGCGDPPACGRRKAGYCPQRQLPMRDGEIALPDLSKPEEKDGKPVDRHTGLILKEPKGSSKRTSPLPTYLVDSLRSHKIAQDIERILAGDAWQDHDLVFTDEFGRPIDPKHDYLEWRELLTIAGVGTERLKRLGVHLGRHTAASLLILMGVSLEVVQEILGHSDSRTTRGYVHVASEMAKEATKRIGAALFKTGITPRTTPSQRPDTPGGLVQDQQNRS